MLLKSLILTLAASALVTAHHDDMAGHARDRFAALTDAQKDSVKLCIKDTCLEEVPDDCKACVKDCMAGEFIRISACYRGCAVCTIDPVVGKKIRKCAKGCYQQVLGS